MPHESQYACGSIHVQRDRFELIIANRFERQQRCCIGQSESKLQNFPLRSTVVSGHSAIAILANLLFSGLNIPDIAEMLPTGHWFNGMHSEVRQFIASSNTNPDLQKQPDTHGEHVCGTRLLQPMGHDEAQAWYSFSGSEHCEPHSLGSTQRELGLRESSNTYGSRQIQPGVHSLDLHDVSRFEQLRVHWEEKQCVHCFRGSEQICCWIVSEWHWWGSIQGEFKL